MVRLVLFPSGAWRAAQHFILVDLSAAVAPLSGRGGEAAFVVQPLLFGRYVGSPVVNQYGQLTATGNRQLQPPDALSRVRHARLANTSSIHTCDCMCDQGISLLTYECRALHVVRAGRYTRRNRACSSSHNISASSIALEVAFAVI